jgi:glycosyltransferase involved in cell wall biosynthesis
MSKPIEVLHILGTAEREGSGIANIVAALAKGLNRKKYKIHAWFLASDGPLIAELRAAGAAACWVGWQGGICNPQGSLRFWRQLQSQDFAIVHQHWGARSIRRLIHAGSNAKLVVHCHGQIHAEDKEGPIPIAVRGADAIIAVAESVARQLPRQQVYVVYSGIERSERVVRTPLAQRDTVVIGTACRLVKSKGVRELISAFAKLYEEFPFLELQIAGSGPEREALCKAAEGKGVAGRVRFLGWRADLMRVLGTWDLFAFSSHVEGLPIAVLEAMAAGLPVIATNVGGIPELVEHERTGYLVPPMDVDALCESLRRVVANPELRSQLGKAGRLRAQRNFSVERMVFEIESIYDALVRGGSDVKPL